MNRAILGFSVALLSAPAVSFADNAILASLESQGVSTSQISNAEMKEIKGAAIITNEAKPTTTRGLFTYMVSWKGAGSQADYRSYRIVGNFFDGDRKLTKKEGGTTYQVAGDSWMADKSGNPNQWVASRASEIDGHYQILDSAGNPTNQAIRNTSWNRPLTTRSW